MPINMTDYKMIYNDRLYNVLQISIEFRVEEGATPKFIRAIYLNEDGMIKAIGDEAWRFQFVRKGRESDGET